MIKLFKKKEKSNNSVKELLKKLKRHDTKVVAIAVIIALILSGGLIYISTPMVASTATEEIAESDRKANKETADKLEEIGKYLTELDKVVTSNQESLSSITSDTDENGETKTSTNTIDKRVVELGGSLKEVHTTIAGTTTKIEELNKALEQSDSSNKEKLGKEFEAINQDLAKIQQQYNEAIEKTNSLASDLKKDINDNNKALGDTAKNNQKALLDELNKMSTDMGETNAATIDTFKEDLDGLNSSVTKKIENVNNNITTKIDDSKNSTNKKIDDLDTSIKGDLSSISSSFDERFTTINNSILSVSQNQTLGTEEIKGLLQQYQNTLNSYNQTVNDSFTSVANGKKLVASALATKGVFCNEDATFQEISNAILSIKEQIYTNEMVASEIEYTYHHHSIDELGSANNHEQVEGAYANDYLSDVQGGCFTEPVYHTHVGSSTSGEGCFTIPKQIQGGHSDAWTSWGYWYSNGDGTQVDQSVLRCTKCGQNEGSWKAQGHNASTSVSSGHDYSGRSGLCPNNYYTVYEPGCGKTEGETIDGYRCSCHMVDNQIIEARIVFPHGAE